MITCHRTDYVTIRDTFEAVLATYHVKRTANPPRLDLYLKAYFRRYDRETAGGSQFDPASPALICLAGRLAEYLAP